MIERFLDTDFTWLISTSILTTLDPPEATNSVSLSFEENNIGVRLLNFSVGSGTVTLVGSANETITFPNNGELFSLNTFTSLTSINTTGLTNESTVGTIEIFLSTPAGAPVEFQQSQGTFKCRLSNKSRTYKGIPQGFEIETKPILFTTYPTPSVSIKDYIQAIDKTFTVESISYPSDLFGVINHQEIELRELVG